MHSRYQKLPAIILLLTFAALATGVIILQVVESRLVETAGETLTLAAVDIAEKLDLLLSERYGDIQMMAQADVFQRHDVKAMTEYLHQLQDAYPVYVWLGVTDQQGRIVASSNPASVGKNRSQATWFEAARSREGIQAQDVEASEEIEGGLAVSFVAPTLGSQGEFMGAVMAQVGLSSLEDAFARTVFPMQTQQGTAGRIEYQFLARDGTVIVDSALREEGRVNLKQLGLPSATLYDSAPPGYVQEGHFRRHVPVITGYARTRGSGEFAGLSWGVMVRRDRQDVLAPTRDVLWKFGAAVSLIFIPSLGFLLWTSVHLRLEWSRGQAEQTRATTAESSLHMRTAKLHSLVESARQLTAHPDLDRLLEHLAEMARQLANAGYAAIGTFDETGKLAKFVTSGMDEATQRAIGRQPVGHGLLGHLAQEDGVLRLKDLTQHPAAVGFPPNHPPMRSFLGAPIRAHGRLLGRLYVTEKEAEGERDAEFTEIDEQVMTALAAQAGVAIENAVLLNEVRAAEAKYRLLLESTGEGIYGIDREGYCIFTNKVGAMQLGYQSDELVGKLFIDMTQPSRSDGSPIPSDQCPVTRALQTGGSCQVDDVLVARRDGSRFPARYVVSPILVNGAVAGAVVVSSDISERKQAQEAIQRSRDFYLKLFDEFPTLIWKSGLDAKCDYVNKSWLSFTGRTLEQELGDGWAEGVHPEDLERCVSTYLEAFHSKKPFEMEYRLRRHDGVYRSIIDIGRPFDDLNGSFAGYIGSCYDVTERKQAESALKESEQRFRTLVESAPVCIHEIDLEGRLLSMNQAGLDMMGATDEAEIVGLTYLDVVAPNDRERIEALLARAGAGEASEFEFSIQTGRDTRRFASCFVPLKGVEGAVLKLMGITRDVTEQARAEETLKMQSRLLESMVEGVSLSDERGIICYTNPAEDAMFGYERGELIGEHVTLLNAYPPDENARIVNGVSEQLKTQGAWSGEFNNRRKNGTPFATFARITSLKIADKNFWLCVQEDITERRRSQEQLKTLQEKLHHAILASNTGLWGWNTQTNEVFFSREWKQQLGYEEHEVAGRFEEWETRLHPDDHDRAMAYVKAYLEKPVGGYALEFRLRHKDGSYRWIAARAAFVSEPDGQRIRLLGAHTDVTQVKQAEAALRESEERLALVLDATNEGLWDWNIKTGTVYYSARWIESLGYTREEVPSHISFWESLVHPEDMPRVRETLRVHFEGRTTVYECENRLRKKSGAWRMNLDRGKVVEWDVDGQPLRMVGTDTDISERKRAEGALLTVAAGLTAVTGQSFFQSLVQHVATMLDADYVLVGELSPGSTEHIRTVAVWGNGARADNFEYDLAHTPCANVISQQPCSYPSGVLQRFPLDTLLADMGVDGYAGTPLRDSRGQVMGLMAVLYRQPIRNIATVESLLKIFGTRAAAELERLRADKALAESQEHFRQVTENIGEVFWMTDPQKDQMVYISPAYEKIWGRPRESLYASPRSWLDAIHPDDRGRVLDAALKKQVAGDYDEVYRIIRADGAIRWIQDRAFPVRDNTGAVCRIAGLAEDVTDRKQAEAEKARRMDLLQTQEQALMDLAKSEAVHQGELSAAFQAITAVAGAALSVGRTGIWLYNEDRSAIQLMDLYEGKKEQHAAGTVLFARDYPAYFQAMEIEEQVIAAHDARTDSRTREFGQSYLAPLDIGAMLDVPIRLKGETVGILCLEHLGGPRTWTPEEQSFAGSLATMVTLALESNEQRKNQKALRESEEQFRSLAEAIPQQVWTARPDGSLDYVNQRTLTYFERQPGDLVGWGWQEVIHPDDLPECLRRWTRALETGEPYEVEFRLKRASDETYRWHIVQALPLVDERGRIVKWFGTNTDITEWKRVEEALRQSETSLANAQHIAHLGNWDWNIVTNELRWSDEIYRIFGLAPTEFGTTYEAFLDSIHPDDREFVKQSVNDALFFKRLYSIDHRILLPDGTVRIVHEQAEVSFDDAGLPIRMAGTVHDITEQKQLEEQLRQAQKMDAIGRLAGGVAHDFNNLLTVINGYSQLLSDSVTPGHPLHKHLEQIRRAGDRAAALTNQLLAFSRKQVLQPKTINLNDLVTNMVRMAERLIGENVVVLTKLCPNLGLISADPGQIEQVILNLAVNARDAMPKGGSLTIETAIAELDEATLGFEIRAQRGSCVLLAVTDTGMGMDKETQTRIFEPFFTTKEQGKGTGLGLATVYGIIKQCNGHILVDSEPGRGTTFRIYFPTSAEIAGGSKTDQPLLQPRRGMETVLLVEDDDMVRSLAQTFLTDYGYKVLEARQGSEALQLFETNEGSIHLLVTDIIMPGMSGRELAECMVSRNPKLKVLYVSGYTDDAVVHHGVREASVAFLQKPFTATALASKVREVLDSPKIQG